MIAVIIRIALRYGAGVLVARGLLGAGDAEALSADPDIQMALEPPSAWRSASPPRPGTRSPANSTGRNEVAKWSRSSPNSFARLCLGSSVRCS
ncbi:hypothetical protein [Mesorhizobium sp.]|uniref:hypothetical protein n=1 Tax=Mesorhizobium sp. TaxID=1871066 RepID=UPI0025EC805D|nr:hypothetical protein [Mesorhizobium sp.]